MKGRLLTVETANPRNFHHAISDAPSMPRLEMIGRLFLPPGDGPFPVVIVVAGSLGLQPPHLEKAGRLVDAGIAACAIDPFHAREVVSTVANQVQYSFAASAWDVLATAAHLAGLPEIDPSRIGAQGHSRGGSAVLSAAATRLQSASAAPALRGVYAAYPWSGQQFLRPDVGSTRVRAVIGDQDDWCLPQQVQAHVHAMRLAGGDATIRIFAGAHHSFDRPTPLETIDEAAVAPSAPTAYIADDGAFLHPLEDAPNPELTDLDLFLYANDAGYGVRGARIGGGGAHAEAFVSDMMAFWRETLGA